MTPTPTRKPAPRERLLETATRLFPAEGIRAVGIDRLLREAGVAKASLYTSFGSKDGLVVAYLDALLERDRDLWSGRAEAVASPRDRIRLLFRLASMPGAGAPPGSAHLAAAMEFAAPATDGETAIRDAVARQRDWLTGVLRDELRAMGLQDEENIDDLVGRLAVLHDGAVTACRLGPRLAPSVDATAMADLVLDLVGDPID